MRKKLTLDLYPTASEKRTTTPYDPSTETSRSKSPTRQSCRGDGTLQGIPAKVNKKNPAGGDNPAGSKGGGNQKNYGA
jgi:hypothetical protein